MLVNPNLGKAWLKKAADTYFNRGLHLEWVTPCGFRVHHKYYPVLKRRSQAKLFDMKQLKFAYRDYDEIDAHAAELAISPNYIHSYDASHMWSTIYEMLKDGVKHFSFVHDSYGCPAPQVGIMRKHTKEQFYATHITNPLEDLRKRTEEVYGFELEECPPTGDLDITRVLGADYLFS